MDSGMSGSSRKIGENALIFAGLFLCYEDNTTENCQNQ